MSNSPTSPLPVSQPRIFGFTLIRNGNKYDYPYKECLTSLAGICEKTVVAVGDSEDGTEASVREFKNIEIIPTLWDENLRKGGVILSQQTNVALNALRNLVKNKESREVFSSAWGVYLQGDEVLLESDFSKIKEDLRKAYELGYDAVSFRYLHFWQDYYQIAIDRRWYPQEIRAIRLDSEIESYGDAQSFRNVKKIYYSDAWIYHIGHVREAEKYQKKLNDFHRWWHSDEEMKKVQKKSGKKDQDTEVLSFLGPFPKVLRERMLRHYQNTLPHEAIPLKEVILRGNRPKTLELGFEDTFRSKSIKWSESECGDVVVSIQDSFLDRVFGKKFPTQMKSPQARVWTEEFILRLRLASFGIASK